MNIFLTILKYLPDILRGVKAVEDAVGPGHGATKKAILLSGITAAAQVGATVDNQTVAAIGATIDHVVGLLNSSGVLGTPPAPVAPVTVPPGGATSAT